MHPNRFGSGNATRSWPVNYQAQHATGLGGVRCYRMPSHRCPLCAIGVPCVPSVSAVCHQCPTFCVWTFCTSNVDADLTSEWWTCHVTGVCLLEQRDQVGIVVYHIWKWVGFLVKSKVFVVSGKLYSLVLRAQGSCVPQPTNSSMRTPVMQK